MPRRLLDPGRLLRARTLRGLSQEQLAKAAGLSTGTIGLYEIGEVDPNPRSLVALAQALDLEVLELSPLPVLPGLADIRARLGLTATEMGERLGVSHTTVYRIEGGGPLGDVDAAHWASHYAMDVDDWIEAMERGDT